MTLNLLMIHGFRTSLKRKKKLVQKANEQRTALKDNNKLKKYKHSNKGGKIFKIHNELMITSLGLNY